MAHRFTLATVYDLPSSWNRNWFVKNIVRSWGFAPVDTYESPQWANALSGLDSNLNGDFAVNRDNRVGQSSIGRGGNTAFDGVLSGVSGSINGTIGPLAPLRIGSGSGSFSSGTPRAFQFGIRVSF